MGKKGNDTTTQSTGPNPAAMDAYNALLSRAAGVASQPYQPYTGDLTAPINSQQQLGINNINQNAGFAAPYIQQAGEYATQLGQGPSGDDLSRYMNPFTQNVVNSTQAQFDRSNASQQNDLRGRAAAQGALGGNSPKIAAADMAYQQQLGQAPVIAGLYNQNYNQAFNAWQQGHAGAASALGNLGVAGQQAALSGAGAQFGAGSAEQQTQQAQLNALYQQYQIAQGFPYQQTQWLAGLDTGVGSQMGGTSQTTSPAPNPFAQYAGVGLAAASMFLKDGGRIPHFDEGGGVSSTPYAGVGWIPQIGVVRGQGAPGAPRPPGQQQQTNPGKTAMDFAKSVQNRGVGAPINLNAYGWNPAGVGDIMPAVPSTGFGPIYHNGGKVAGFAEGGVPDYEDDTPIVPNMVKTVPVSGFGEPLSFDDRWAPARDAISVGDFDPQGMNNTSAYAPGVARAGGPDTGRIPFPPSRPDVSPEDAWAPAPREGDVPNYAVTPGLERDFNPAPVAPTSKEAGRGFGLGLLPSDLRGPLLTAGLAMMASRSPHLGNAIGEGGLAGVGAYTHAQEKKTETELKREQQAMQGRSYDLQAKRLDQAAEQARQRLALQTKAVGLREDAINQGRYRPIGMTTEDGHPVLMDGKSGQMVDGVTQAPITNETKIINPKEQGGLTPQAIEVNARRLNQGDLSVKQNLGRGAQGARDLTAIQNKAVELLTAEDGMTAPEAAKFQSLQKQSFRMQEMAQGSAARTAGTRAANLDMIIEVTDAAILAALQASKEAWRTGWVPLNQIIQKGQVIASDPKLKVFGMANLQLAEAWARAMNPTGVMRESDRDKALHYLNEADSPDTYGTAVKQLQTQIHREREGVESFKKKFGIHSQMPDRQAPEPGTIGNEGSTGGSSASKPARVKQGGHTFELQPDGNYKAVD